MLCALCDTVIDLLCLLYRKRAICARVAARMLNRDTASSGAISRAMAGVMRAMSAARR